MRYTEERLQMILGEISAYLANKEMQRSVWSDILMDLEEFLVFKRRFVDGLDDTKRKLYWDN